MTSTPLRFPQPDWLLIGAPKAGTTAIHAALRQHPKIFVTDPKEPKYWLCDDAPPPAWCGPGDAHSQQEWIWRRDQYENLFVDAPEHKLRGESTPFYLWSKGAHRRIGEALPNVKLIAVIRDPVDRAYSNWMHLWSDGLEPEPDFEKAFALEMSRIREGYAPFWRYRGLGRYGDQLQHLFTLVDPERVLVLRYREIIEDPVATVNKVCRFLGIAEGVVTSIPRDNSRPFVQPGWRPKVMGPVVRGGAAIGQFAPPRVWRKAAVPITNVLTGGGDHHRPHLTEEQRARLVPHFEEDIALLSELTGQDFSDWLSNASKGSFAQRSAAS